MSAGMDFLGGKMSTESRSSLIWDGEFHLMQQEELESLTKDVSDLKETIGRLQDTFESSHDFAEGGLRIEAHERLSDMLRILRQVLEKYPLLQSNELLESASRLIYLVKEFNFENQDLSIFKEALDILAQSVRNRVAEYLSGDLDWSLTSLKKSIEHLAAPEDDDFDEEDDEDDDDEEEENVVLSPHQIDALLMRHETGVDHALKRAKIWAKYSKDVMTYVEKRTSFEMEFCRNVTKLAQTMRPILKEESYLPFQSVYCTALDQDLEMCTATQATIRSLQGQKFLEPLGARRADHEKIRKALKDKWYKELKKMHDVVSNLRKARTNYMQRKQEYERCREAVRIAEQGAEIGATCENKVDKRKRLEEDALTKTVESESIYRCCVTEANDRHRNLLLVKAEFLQQIRELILQCDQTMKAVTVSYFQLQHSRLYNAPIQFLTLCESSRLYEPGSTYMEYVKRMPEPQSVRFSSPDPFTFEPYSEYQIQLIDKQRKISASANEFVDSIDSGTYKLKGEKLKMAWTPSLVPVEPSDTESVESRESTKSQETSPSASPLIQGRSSVDVEMNETDKGSSEGLPSLSIRCSSKAASTHTFRKLKTFSKCRECDTLFFQGYECIECGISMHKKCLEHLTLTCGHRRLIRKLCTFGVDLTTHVMETGSQIPPLFIKCVHEIDSRGLLIKGIYRVSSVKSKVEKLCLSFENGAELVELGDIHPVVIANVLKFYMRQLPEPLLSFKLYPEFIRIAKNSSGDASSILHELKSLIHRLSKPHFLTAANLMHHLRRVSQEHAINNMPASNLAIIFGPNLLRISEHGGSTDLSAVVDAVHQAKIIELLIVHSIQIFGSEDEVKPHDYERYISPQPSSSSTSSELRRRRQRQRVESEGGNHILEAYLAGAAGVGNSDEEYEEEDDADIPDFLLPESSKYKKSLSHSGPPTIIKQSLKNFSGLEGLTPGMLSNQDANDTQSSSSRQSKSYSATSSSEPNVGCLPKQKSSLESQDFYCTQGRKGGQKTSFDDSIDGGSEKLVPILRSYQSPSSGRSSLLIGINSSRSSSLSDENSHVSLEQRRKLQTAVSSIVNLEENKVKIQVPGLHYNHDSSKLLKQFSSTDKEDNV